MPSLDFTIPAAVAAAFAVSFTLPVALLLIARVPLLSGRNALQFLVSAVVTVVAWIIVLLSVPDARSTTVAEIIVGAMLLGAAFLVYLEIWGLLSRGYTLGLLITIRTAGRPLPAAELARRYRGGEGLEWIMRHRLAGLEAAGLVEREGPRLVLTRLGRAVAWSYRTAVTLLGLKATG
jgi:hypothetical protein